MTFQEALLRRRVRFRVSQGVKIHLCCPFCLERGKGEDKLFRLCVHSVQGWGRCMHCDWKRRSAVFAVLKQLGIPDTVSGFERTVAPTEQEQVTLPADFQLLTRVYDDLDRQARKYVLDRGITPLQIEENKIGVSYCGRYAYRVVFPVFVGQELKGINARDFTGSQTPKYLNNRGSKYFYRFDPAAHTLVFSEGVFKALRIAQVTEAHSSALLGHDLTEHQIAQLEDSRCEQVILYPDTDPVGKRGFVKIADRLAELSRRIAVKIAWPVDLPADEAPLENIKALVHNALPYSWHLRQKILLNRQ